MYQSNYSWFFDDIVESKHVPDYITKQEASFLNDEEWRHYYHVTYPEGGAEDAVEKALCIRHHCSLTRQVRWI